MEETNAADHYDITKFDLYKDDICLICVLMDNFLSLFFYICARHEFEYIAHSEGAYTTKLIFWVESNL